MKLPRSPSAVAWSKRLLFPALLLAMAVYYLHGMTGYISPLNTPDEFGYISVAAFLNGHNWVAVARGVPWASYGYSLLLAPVFALTSPQHWYHAAQWVNVALIVLIGICANLFLRKVDRESPAWLRHLVVAVVLLYPSLVFYARFAWPETMVALMPWLLGWLMYRIFEVPNRNVDAFLCGCLLVASYYIHERLIVLEVAALLVFLFVGLQTKRWRELGFAVLGMVVVLVPALWFKDFLLANLYGGAVSGTQVSIVKMLASVWHNLDDPNTRSNFIGSASGQLAYLIIAPLGLAVVGLWVFARRLLKGWRQRDWATFAALAFVLLGAMGCYALIAVTMGLDPVMPQHVFYGRYTEPLVLPLVVTGLLHLYRKPRHAVWWMLAALLVACVLVPLGVYAVRHLHTAVTYWTLLTGLFTYRSAHWQLANGPLLLGFLAVTVVLGHSFRLHRYLGLGLVTACFFCAGYGLLQTYASAPFSHVRKWQTWPVPASSLSGQMPRLVKLDMLPGDPAKLRTRIQVINAASTVVPDSQWPATFSGEYENMVWTGKIVQRSFCSVNTPGNDSCKSLVAPPRPTVSLKIEAGRTLGVSSAFLPEGLRNYLARLPYLRAVWGEAASHHATVHYVVNSPTAFGLSANVFVTKPGKKHCLVNRSIYKFIAAGHHVGNMSIPVPVRTGAGVALPRGFYTLHVVVAGPDGKEWATMASVPMRIR